MKLTKVQVTNFRSVEDSGEFTIGDLTCLVGKNEAGKTAILNAIQGIAPSDGDYEYDKTRDYPRRYLSKFAERHPKGNSPVAKSWWLLEDDDVLELEDLLGEGVVKESEVTITSYIGHGNTWMIPVDEKGCITKLQARHGLNQKDKADLKSVKTTQEALGVLKGLSERSESQTALMQAIEKFRDGSAVLAAIDLLSKIKPKFFYTSHFERMSGEISLNQLASDKQNGKVSSGDRIFLDFLEYAGTTIEELRDATKHEELVAQCEGASNDITDEIFEFWSQNDALAIKIEINEGRPDDPPPLNSGKIAKIRIENKHHRVTVPLSERSAGFVWFFSFLAQFKQLKKSAGKSIILLDEPGLTLHGKAQSDLLRYIEERILPEHQVIYTTHSPFMVPAKRLADVRVVEDVVDYRDPRRPVVKGTKVSADVLSVDKDTLFPLQAHLGYEITQSLFVGENCLLVEGPSDVVYLQVVSRALQARGRTGLDDRWTICPTGGLDKVWSFSSLFTGNNLNIAVLCDYGKGDKAKVERLRQSQILKSERVLTASDFTEKSESDIEDLFDNVFYCALVNQALGLKEGEVTAEKANAADKNSSRIVKQVEALCRTLPADTPDFGHYVPAEYLLRNPQILDGEDDEVTGSLDRFENVFKALNGFWPNWVGDDMPDQDQSMEPTQDASVNLLKVRDDHHPICFRAKDDGTFELCEVADVSWLSDGQDIKLKDIRKHVEPWLTALFQSEHLSLLAGSGLTHAVHEMATGELAADMSGNVTDGDYKDKIIAAAEVSAKAAGRDKSNIEDQFRIANELLRGMEIVQQTEKADALRDDVSNALKVLAKSILQSEGNITSANEDKRVLAFNALITFLMSFSSRTGTRDRLNIFTTNYDRLLEMGAELAGLHLLDRFVGNLMPIFRSSRLDLDMHYNPPGIRGEPRYLEGVARFSKLHGSIDWVQTESDIRRIGLPFGAKDVGPFLDAPGLGEVTSHRLMIYPNAAKDRETAEYPYVELFRDLAAAVCRPNSTLVTYGYSFGDEHINRVIRDMLTIPSTHLVVISRDDNLGRILPLAEERKSQVSLLVGPQLADLATLTEYFLPKAAIDKATFRMSELLKQRYGAEFSPHGGTKSDGQADTGATT